MAQHERGAGFPPYSDGGEISRGGTALVGERGPERPAPRPGPISWGSTFRIALAVFAGVLAAMVVAGIASYLFVASVANDVSDEIDKSFGTSSDTGTGTGTTSSLSESCETYLRTVEGQTLDSMPANCASDDGTAVITRMLDLNITYTGS